jgi:hypothetical protein
MDEAGSVQIITDPDPRGPKICGFYGNGSGSGTLQATKRDLIIMEAQGAFQNSEELAFYSH